MFNNYFHEIKRLINEVEKQEARTIQKAAETTAEKVAAGGLLYVFGCGHSHMMAEELFYRAGGLVPVYPILEENLMLHKGPVHSSQLERQSGYAHSFIEELPVNEKDVLLVVSTSGRNGVPVDAALLGKQKGCTVIGLTSKTYASSQPSRHETGKHLHDTADLILDNHIPKGDALLQAETEPELRFAPGSSLINIAILQGMMAEVVHLLEQKQIELPIFKSANIEGSDEHNRKMVDKYKNQIPLLKS
ncbi:SIS domain-containing protein [Alteribacillus sp. JSM 102045]|uniref:SIS domain-containing protein n=1 Tax=Alteribacillus sp. JSM 102045 TaxID=1562101 RepID=UPI0035BF8F81